MHSKTPNMHYKIHDTNLKTEEISLKHTVMTTRLFLSLKYFSSNQHLTLYFLLNLCYISCMKVSFTNGISCLEICEHTFQVTTDWTGKSHL